MKRIIGVLLLLVLANAGCESASATEPIDYFDWNYELDKYAWDVAMSADGSYIAVANGDMDSDQIGNVLLLNNNGEKLWNYEIDNAVWDVAISADGSYVVAGVGWDNNNVYLFNCDGEILWNYNIADTVRGVAMSADGSYVAACSGDWRAHPNGTIYLFNLDGEILWTYDTVHEVDDIAISADGSSIAAVMDSDIYFFNNDGEKLWNYNVYGTNDDRGVNCISISANGSYVVAGSSFGKIYLFNKDGKKLWMSYSTKNTRATGGGLWKLLQLWRISSTKIDYNSIQGVSISADGSYVAAGGYDGFLYFFDQNGEKLWTYDTGVFIDSVSTSADGSSIAVGGNDVHLLNINSVPATNDTNTNDTNWLFIGVCALIVLGGIVAVRKRRRITSEPKPTPSQKPHKPAKRLALEPDFIPTENDSQLDEAKSVIQDAEADLQDAMNKGVQVPQSIQQLLQDAQKEVDAGHLATAKEYASKCSKKVGAAVKDFMQRKEEQARKQRELEQLRKDASEQIKSAKDLLEKAGILGIPTLQNAEDLLTTARSSFDAKKYAAAKEDAQHCRDIIDGRIEESKPEIAIALPSRMQHNVWKCRDITVTNNGTAHAKNIAISFSKALEARELKTIPQLKVGEEKTLHSRTRPTEEGDVPIDYTIQFTDMQEGTYKTKHTTIIPISREPELPAPEPVPSDQFTTFRTVWDPNPGNRDFVWSRGKPDEYGELPRIKEWIGDKNPNIYWFLLKIVNRADYPVTEWNVTLYTEQALMITKAHLNDKRVRIVDSSFDTNKNRNKYVVSIPPELCVSIPAKGGTRLMYFETDIRCEDALKMEFGVSGIVRLGTTPQIEVPIREKRFTYACKYGDFKKMFYGSIDALASQVMENLQDSYRREIVQNFANSFRLIRDFENYCKNRHAEPEILIDKLEAVYSSLRAAEPITKDEILPFVEENLDVIRKLGGAAPNVEAQKERGMRMCERPIGLLHQVKMVR